MDQLMLTTLTVAEHSCLCASAVMGFASVFLPDQQASSS